MQPYYNKDGITIYHGDCREVLPTLEAGSVHCCVTSPPYWGLRDYGTGTWEGGDEGCDHVAPPTGGPNPADGCKRRGVGNNDTQYLAVCGKCGARRIDSQIGLEASLDEYVATMVEVFREVRRVLRDDGTLWLNLGDSYASSGAAASGEGGEAYKERGKRLGYAAGSNFSNYGDRNRRGGTAPGLKPKDLCGIPWRVAFALQADGWYLRQDIIWAKPNPMPESVTDRCTKAHEYLFLLSKSARYYFDADAIREESSGVGGGASFGRQSGDDEAKPGNWKPRFVSKDDRSRYDESRNRRSVWTIPTYAYPGSHFATFPPKLIEPCIKAGTSEEGCCPECGAPWERVVEKETVRDHASTRDMPKTPLNVVRAGWRKGGPKSETTGWRATCECPEAKPIPCTVCDPFLGSGTSAYVARQMACKSIGIELNEEYLKLVTKRIEQRMLFA